MKAKLGLTLTACAVALLALVACVGQPMVAPPAMPASNMQEMATDSDSAAGMAADADGAAGHDDDAGMAADADGAAGHDHDADMAADADGAMAADDGDTEQAAPMPQIPPATMTKLADGIYHYFGFFSSSLVVLADDGVLITDTNNELRAQSLKDEIAKITDVPVTRIVMTHEHYDHVGGSLIFEDAEVFCHVNCQAAFDLFAYAVSDVPTVAHTFEDYLALDVGGKTVELHYLGPGDGEATTVIYMPEEQIVVTADMYEPRALTHRNWVEDKHFVGTRHILNTISQWPLTHAVNAHSPGTNPQDLYENVEYYNDLYAAVQEAIQQAVAQGGPFAPYSLYDSLPETLHLEKYQDWTNYDNSFARHVQRMLVSIYHSD